MFLLVSTAHAHKLNPKIDDVQTIQAGPDDKRINSGKIVFNLNFKKQNQKTLKTVA